MKLVLDTNILISCLLKPDGRMSELFFHPQVLPTIFAPERLMSELSMHRAKVVKLSGLPTERIAALEELLLSRVTIVPNTAVPSIVWERG